MSKEKQDMDIKSPKNIFGEDGESPLYLKILHQTHDYEKNDVMFSLLVAISKYIVVSYDSKKHKYLIDKIKTDLPNMVDKVKMEAKEK